MCFTATVFNNRSQNSKSENSRFLKNNTEEFIDGKEDLEKCQTYCPKTEDEENKMAITQSLEHSPQNLQNLSILTRQKSTLEKPNNLPSYSEVVSIEETATMSRKHLNLGSTSNIPQAVTFAGVKADFRRSRWQRSRSLPSATTKVRNRWKTVDESGQTELSEERNHCRKLEAKSKMEETTVQIETTL